MRVRTQRSTPSSGPQMRRRMEHYGRTGQGLCIHMAGLDTWQRPFEGYQDQPDTAERVRLELQSIPFGLPGRPLD